MKGQVHCIVGYSILTSKLKNQEEFVGSYSYIRNKLRVDLPVCDTGTKFVQALNQMIFVSF